MSETELLEHMIAEENVEVQLGNYHIELEEDPAVANICIGCE